METLIISVIATTFYFGILLAYSYMEEELNHIFNQNHDF